MTPLDAALTAIPRSLDPFARARMRATLIAYTAAWDTVDCEVLAVEREFRTPFVRPDGTEDPEWDIAGKIDLILRVDGRIGIFDHKTSAEDVSPGSPFRERLKLHKQPPHYILGARSLGIHASFFCFDVIGKLGIEPLQATPRESWHVVAVDAGVRKAAEQECGAKWGEIADADKARLLDKYPRSYRLSANQRLTDETPVQHFIRAAEKIIEDPDRFFAPIDVVRNARELERHEFDLYRISTQIDTVRAYDLTARNEGSCVQYGRACGYHAVCAGEASLDDVRLFERRRPHEELAPLDGKRRLLTVSRMQSFLSCQERHELRYERGIAPLQKDDALVWGTAVHACVEQYWRARAPESVRCAA